VDPNDVTAPRYARHRVTHLFPMGMRTLPFRAADRIAAEIDRRRLRRTHPEIAAAAGLGRHDDELRPVYDRYVNEVSSWEWAVSWPTVRLIDALCDEVRPRRILDLGSGLSTYVECAWARRTGLDVEVVSVDDSADWLGRTRDFLAGEQLRARLLDASELPTLEGASFDLAFDDIGRSEDRARVVDEVVRLMNPGGLVIFDDMNVRGYRGEVRRLLDTHGWGLYSLRRETRDEKGRFAMLGFPRP